jgi:hypothetical protein
MCQVSHSYYYRTGVIMPRANRLSQRDFEVGEPISLTFAFRIRYID